MDPEGLSLLLKAVPDVVEYGQAKLPEISMDLLRRMRSQVTLEVGDDLLGRTVCAVALDLRLGSLLHPVQGSPVRLCQIVRLCSHDRIKNLTNDEFGQLISRVFRHGLPISLIRIFLSSQAKTGPGAYLLWQQRRDRLLRGMRSENAAADGTVRSGSIKICCRGLHLAWHRHVRM